MSNDKQAQELIKATKKYIWTSLSKYADIEKEPKIFVKGAGCYLVDVNGKRYLDTFASLLTTISGHHRPEVARAMQEQMAQLEFFPNYHDCYTVPIIKLAEKLARIAPGELSVSYFVNDGSEACERQSRWRNSISGRAGRVPAIRSSDGDIPIMEQAISGAIEHFKL